MRYLLGAAPISRRVCCQQLGIMAGVPATAFMGARVCVCMCMCLCMHAHMHLETVTLLYIKLLFSVVEQ